MTKTVAVIDGNSLMHRAYHAIQTPMTAPDGTPTNAIFGFMQMFCKFVEDTAPDAVICTFDKGKPEHRLEEMPEYKAQRPHMDEELRAQFPVIEKLLVAMDVPIVTAEGWEGDDVLGTIASMDEKLGYKTLLVTGDKDACQLATDLTKIVTTKKGISEVAIYGPDEVMEKYGVTPAQFIDYLGLMGDSSDNIPGVPGIGPKSAQKLLEAYGNLEGIYEHIDELKGKQKENLVENEKLAYLSRQIATIITDLDLDVDLENTSFPSFQPEDVEKAFKEYALASPLTRVLRLVGESATADVVEIDAGLVEPDQAAGLIDDAIAADERIGIAFAQSGQDTIFGVEVTVAFSTEKGTAVVDGEAAMNLLLRVIRDGRFATLNLKEALRLVYAPDTDSPALISDDELYAVSGFSLVLAAYALLSTGSDYSLERLAEKYLGGELPEQKERTDALAQDAAATRLLAKRLEAALDEDDSAKMYRDIDLPLVPVLVQIERTGVELDVERLGEVGAETQTKLTELSQQIFAIAGESFNIDSPKQLQHILFEKMGITPLKKNQRGYSTDASVLTELAKTEEIASLVLQYRELSKIKSTYIDNLPKMRGADRRLHTDFNETVTATGRLSSSNPNLQNIPVRTDYGRLIRECFIPLDDDAVFLSADYSQIELRLLANLSGDRGLIDAFNSGADFHAQTAANVFGVPVDEVTPQLRSRAKAVNFGIVYGQQAYGLSQALDIEMGEARDMIERYYAAYPAVREYLDRVIEEATEKGYAETMFGRKRRIPELSASKKQVHALGERLAMNHPMQGSAADIIKLAMIDVACRLRTKGFRSALLLQVHDELDFSAKKDEVEALAVMVKEAMENVVELEVPLLVEVSWGPNWATAH